MARVTRIPTVQSRAATLEAELAALRQVEAVITTIRTLKRKFPELVEEFSRQIHAAVDDEITDQEMEAATPAGDESVEQEYGVEKLIAFFRRRNNEPATIRDMAKAIDRSEKTVKSIIYHRHPGKFVTTPQRGRNNRAYFRMAEE